MSKRYYIKIWMLSFFIILSHFFVSCDPTYSIKITNDSSDSVILWINENNNFYTRHKREGFTADDLSVYKVLPNEEIVVGMAIAELSNDIPFSEIWIITNTDTTSIRGSKNILELFDRGSLGQLKKPYNISVPIE